MPGQPVVSPRPQIALFMPGVPVGPTLAELLEAEGFEVILTTGSVAACQEAIRSFALAALVVVGSTSDAPVTDLLTTMAGIEPAPMIAVLSTAEGEEEREAAYRLGASLFVGRSRVRLLPASLHASLQGRPR